MTRRFPGGTLCHPCRTRSLSPDTIDNDGIPVFPFTRQEVTPFQDQNPFAARRQPMREGSPSRTRADDDDVITFAAHGATALSRQSSAGNESWKQHHAAIDEQRRASRKCLAVTRQFGARSCPAHPSIIGAMGHTCRPARMRRLSRLGGTLGSFGLGQARFGEISIRHCACPTKYRSAARPTGHRHQISLHMPHPNVRGRHHVFGALGFVRRRHPSGVSDSPRNRRRPGSDMVRHLS
jgi:hypothetical protein